MSTVIHSTTVGPMNEDRIWSVYLDWYELPELFNDPQAWAKGLKDASGTSLNARLADGIIAIVVLYPLDRASDVNEPPLVVQGGDYASVLQVRAVSSYGMPVGGIDPNNWLQANENQPGIPVTEVQITTRPIDRLGFLHFPLSVTRIGDTVAEIAQNPQRLVDAVAKWETEGQVPVRKTEAGTGAAPTSTVTLVNLTDAELKKLCLVYHIGAAAPADPDPIVSVQPPSTAANSGTSAAVGAAAASSSAAGAASAAPGGSSATCAKVSGTLDDSRISIDTIVFYQYADSPSPTPIPTPVPSGAPSS